MENNNLEYIKKNLKFLGFGISLNAALEAKVSERAEQFKLGVSADFSAIQKDGILGKDKVNYELNFSKPAKTEYYFLNSFKVTLNGQLENTFPFGRGNDVTAKEAYNLLRGASILKKAILTNKFDLSMIAPDGSKSSKGSFENLEEIRNTILQDNSKKSTIYQVSEKGIDLRQYDHNANLVPFPQKKLQVNFNYVKENDKSAYSAIYSVQSFKAAMEKIKSIAKDGAPGFADVKTKGFSIIDSERNLTLLELEKDGKEVDITPQKKNEQIWIKLDFDKQNEDGSFSFKKFYQNYGFNLESELKKYPIIQLENEQEKEMLISSLGRGNTQKANLDTGQAVFIEVDPQFKKIRFYDMDCKNLELSQTENQELNR